MLVTLMAGGRAFKTIVATVLYRHCTIPLLPIFQRGNLLFKVVSSTNIGFRQGWWLVELT
jgi:hypothetical protein